MGSMLPYIAAPWILWVKNFIIPKMEVNLRIHVYEWLMVTPRTKKNIGLFMLPSLTSLGTPNWNQTLFMVTGALVFATGALILQDMICMNQARIEKYKLYPLHRGGMKAKGKRIKGDRWTQ